MSFNTNDELQVKDLLTIKTKTDIVTAAGATEINNDLIATKDNLATNYHTKTVVNQLTSTLNDKFNNYYTKSETSGASELTTKFADYYTKAQTSSTTQLNTKFNDYYTKAQTSSTTQLNTKFNDYYTKTEVTGLTSTLNDKFNNYYTKAQTSSTSQINTKFNSYYTKTELDNKLATIHILDLDKFNSSSLDYGVTIYTTGLSSGTYTTPREALLVFKYEYVLGYAFELSPDESEYISIQRVRDNSSPHTILLNRGAGADTVLSGLGFAYLKENDILNWEVCGQGGDDEGYHINISFTLSVFSDSN